MLGKLTCVPVDSDQPSARIHWQDHKAHGKTGILEKSASESLLNLSNEAMSLGSSTLTFRLGIKAEKLTGSILYCRIFIGLMITKGSIAQRTATSSILKKPDLKGG